MATAAVQSGVPSRHDRLFLSVFPAKVHTTPTPQATPNIGVLASPGAPFGGPNAISSFDDDALQHNRAWSAATRFLILPSTVTAQPRSLSTSPDASNAMEYLVHAPAKRKDLHDWYMHEVGIHFQRFVVPELSFWKQAVVIQQASNALAKTVEVLCQAQQLYLSLEPEQAEATGCSQALQDFMQQVKRDLHVLVVHSLPGQRIQKTIASYLFQAMCTGMKRSENSESCLNNNRCRCSPGLDRNALVQLFDVGLGGTRAERAFAHAIHKLLAGPAVERRCFQVDWSGKSTVTPRLRAWVHEILAPSIQQALASLTGRTDSSLPVSQLESLAVNSLGRRRVDVLFDYVSSFPASQGAIQDIRDYLGCNGSREKAHLCASFSDQVQRRLLHAGATTTEILSIYINVISVFNALDSRGVLLEKVAIPIRSYLRSRDDTVHTIAASFLADVDESGDVHAQDPEKVCTDIAIAIASSSVDAQDDRLLDWSDMEWVPDPIDAGPNYKSTKSDDIVAYVLGLFETDDFVRALAAAFGDHLLHAKESELMKETRLVELLKARLEANKLQQVEVMLKDIRDSAWLNRRIHPDQYKVAQPSKPTPKEIQAALPDEGVTIISLFDLFKHRIERKEFLAAVQLVAKRRGDLYFPKRTRLPADPALSSPATAPAKIETRFEARVLSSHFWPELRDADFKIPDQAKEHIHRYEQAFSNISGQRKLQWKHTLGTTDVELQLEDRVVKEMDIELWKVSVIDAFAPAEDVEVEYDISAGLSMTDLVGALEMDEEFVQSALHFWVSKGVLYETSEGRFAVLERLNMDVQHIMEGSMIDDQPISAIETDATKLRKNADTYHTFILGMLRNSGAKEIEGMMGITNMMKMVIPEFTFGDKDVRWLLEQLERQGHVARNGELWAAIK